MEKEKPQDFAHHGRFFPPLHFFVVPVFLVNFVYSCVQLRHGFSFHSILNVFVAAALLTLAPSARIMALAVQDRVIRLEMQLRMAELLPTELQARIVEFTPEQLIGLRFASDEELPELAQRVLAEQIADRKAIKQLVKKWRPDYMRA
jgi:ABC-type amino acid transport substrate-binding protein